MKDLIVNKKYHNKKLSKFILDSIPELTFNNLKMILRKKDIKVNDTRISKDCIIQNCDKITIYIPNNISKKQLPKIDKFYEDKNILIINKPQNLEVTGTNSLTTLIHEMYSDSDFKPMPCHRLDRNTCGLILFAKNQKSLDILLKKFKNHEIDILISTTVIEVGVDVPNSNIMVIEDAQRFGLAQLHQLRGRVGRGEYQSYCILKYEGNGENIRKRMKVMCDTNDGFKISEKDLELRGSGDFFGTMQHGLPEFKIANLFEDMPILQQVQQVAQNILSKDTKLENEENKELAYIVNKKLAGLGNGTL